MCEIWMRTKEQFVGDHRVDDSDPDSFDRTAERVVDEGTRAWMASTIRPVPGRTGIASASVRGDATAVALLCRDVHGEWSVAGGYVGETLWLDHGLRGKGLGAELVLLKADRLGGFVQPESYTTAGRRAHEAAHDLAVERALAEGFRVPGHIADAARKRDGAVSGMTR